MKTDACGEAAGKTSMEPAKWPIHILLNGECGAARAVLRLYFRRRPPKVMAYGDNVIINRGQYD